MKKGWFISIEGVEGAGKSTLIQHVSMEFNARGYACTVTREPGGSLIAETIRNVLLNSEHEEVWMPETEMLLMYAARAQHINTVILPVLSQGESVISDRFSDASYAYQVAARGASLSLFQQLETHITGKCVPDLTLLLDLDPELGMHRVASRTGQLDRIEKEKIEFFKHVRAGYLQRAAQFPERMIVVDASVSEASVKSSVSAIVADFFSKKVNPS